MTLKNYRDAICYRNEAEQGTEEWKIRTRIMDYILETGLKEGNRVIAAEYKSDIYSLVELTWEPESLTKTALIEIKNEIRVAVENLFYNGFEDMIDEDMEEAALF